MTYFLDIAALLGAASIVVGVAMMHVPAALITAGVLTLALVVSVIRRGEGSTE